MAKQNNLTCVICGKKYGYCPVCGEDSSKPTWYFVFDGENCNNIYEICTSYRDKKITAKEAYDALSKLDLTSIEDFAESTKKQIKEIIKLNEETVGVKDDNKAKEKTEAKNEYYKGNYTNKRK